MGSLTTTIVANARWTFAATACLLVVACGGGGDGQESANVAPAAMVAGLSAGAATDMTALGAGRRSESDDRRSATGRCSHYEFTDLGTLGGTQSAAAAVNDSGSVVGYAYLPGDLAAHAVLWAHGRTIDLGTLGGASSYATDVNDDGKIVGTSTLADGTSHATLWSGGKVRDLGAAGGLSSSAEGINDAGQIVGSAHLGSAHDVAILWNGKSTTQLSPINGAVGASPWISSIATDISDKGLIVGQSGTRFYDDHGATSWTNRNPASLDGLGDSFALGVNNLGTIVGISGAHPGFPGRATVWTGTTPTLLTGLFADSLGRYEAFANAINDAGQIAGSSATNANVGAHAVLWNSSNSAPIDLNNFLDMNAVGAGWVLTSASGINNKGWIAGQSSNTLTGQSHGFLLTLVSEPDRGNSSRRPGVFCASDL